MTASETSRGPLILLGGMGFQPGLVPVWKEIVAAPARLTRPAARTLILPLLPPVHKPAVEQRVRLAEELFSSLEIVTQTLWEHSQYPSTPSEATSLFDSVFVVAAEPLTTVPDILWQWNRAGLAIIATAGVAAALGEHAFTPIKPCPPTLETLEFELRPGAGILPGAAVLPYFDRFPDGLLGKLAQLFPPETTLIGIDEQAALVAGVDGWHVAGLGCVSILSHNQVVLAAEAGASIPGRLLALNR